ncbi:MAG: DUF512 domain-containing protein [Oscillospiraceae bacterium]|nr:DUF512 domain-containing protein [Oscillospiraceae bacterium]
MAAKNVIKTIEKVSPLYGKVKAGDQLISINGNIVKDVLDYKFYGYDRKLKIEILTAEGKSKTIRVRKIEGMDLGLEFETYLMDAPRSCANRCVFCFIDQNPAGMRKSIYFKDDDARLSFLMGCYITLTNLSKREIQRIIDLHISPVNISVHTTDPVLREEMLCSKRAGEVMELMTRFAEAGITMNCQIVCCPGINDGEALLRSMVDLRSLYPAVNSVSIVPLGLTKHREGLRDLEAFTPEHAGETIDMVEEFAQKCLEETGTRLFFCSDEMYLKAGRALPEDDFYEEHTQLDNGVGMIRLLEKEFEMALDCSESADGVSFSMATAADFAPFLENLLCTAEKKYDNIKGKVYSIRNDFYGESVTVAGLITGRDLISQLKGKQLGQRLLISANMLRQEEMDFLDDITLEEAEKELGVKIYPISQDGGELCDAMLGIMPQVQKPKADAEDTEYNKYNQ